MHYQSALRRLKSQRSKPYPCPVNPGGSITVNHDQWWNSEKLCPLPYTSLKHAPLIILWWGPVDSLLGCCLLAYLIQIDLMGTEKGSASLLMELLGLSMGFATALERQGSAFPCLGMAGHALLPYMREDGCRADGGPSLRWLNHKQLGKGMTQHPWPYHQRFPERIQG